MPGRGDGRKEATAEGGGRRRATGERVGRVCRDKEMAGRNRERLSEAVRLKGTERTEEGADRGPREQRGTAGVQRKRTGGPKSMQDNRRGRPQSEGASAGRESERRLPEMAGHQTGRPEDNTSGKEPKTAARRQRERERERVQTGRRE